MSIRGKVRPTGTYIGLTSGSAAAVSEAGEARIRYNTALNRAELSENGGPYSPMMTAASHAALRQLIHFIDEGPAEEFASGAYKEVVGTLYPSSETWYDHAGAGKKKIVEKLITWTGPLPTTVVWKMYDAAENLLVTLTDAITYNGVYEASRLRTLA